MDSIKRKIILIVITFVSGALIQKFLYIIKERKEKRDGYVTRE